MNQSCGHPSRARAIVFSLFVISLLWGASMGSAEEAQIPSSLAHEELSQPGEEGDIKGRGLHKVPRGKNPREIFAPRQPQQPEGGLPPHLCQQITHMLTQCRCANTADCQVLTGLCPGACPAGSQNCQCTPLFRGTPPTLPPNLCGVQVPTVVTQCTCTNQAECQLLSPFCPGSCPAGSQSCECTPLQRR